MQPAEIKQESIVSYLPLSHIAAQIYDLWTGIQWGELVYFAQPDALKVYKKKECIINFFIMQYTTKHILVTCKVLNTYCAR